MARQKLLTKEILSKLPKLYSTENVPAEEKQVIVKFFGGSSASWYAIEFDGEDRFFGYVKGLGDDELGYFSLSELQSVRFPPFGLPIERDAWFKIGTKLADVIAGRAR